MNHNFSPNFETEPIDPDHVADVAGENREEERRMREQEPEAPCPDTVRTMGLTGKSY
jgi:hypothetical protein